jgi:hypothetical protein
LSQEVFAGERRVELPELALVTSAPLRAGQPLRPGGNGISRGVMSH